MEVAEEGTNPTSVPSKTVDMLWPLKAVFEDALFLAMAYQGTGETKKAREWYERALPLLNPKNPEQVGFKEEAAALLEAAD